nr:cytochrome C556 [Rhizobium sp. Khangiran2]
MLSRSCLIAAAVCLGLSPALAQEEPQVVRQELMKEIGQSVGAMGAIAKGEKPYDAAVVEQSLTVIGTNIQAFPDHFPAGTESGHETEALPAVWEKPEEFRASAKKLHAEAQAQLASLPADQAAVGAAMRNLGAICSDCHETFRAKKQ